VFFNNLKIDFQNLKNSTFVRNEELVFAKTLQNHRVSDKNVVAPEIILICVYCLQGRWTKELLAAKSSLSLSVNVVNVASTSEELMNSIFANGIEYKCANEATLFGNVMTLDRMIIADANE